MEDLVQHCVRELAFDGELGCDVTRLQHFIEGFYNSRKPKVDQKVDEAFCRYVWSLLAEQPSVIVGLVPEGGGSEVYIAPQPSKQRALGKKKKTESEDQTGRLNAIADASSRSLESLLQEYGNNLRVAVGPEACFEAITGTHTRPAKLTPMVYTALQLISRGRESGLTVIDLGKKTGYDQKTCFYLVKQLLSLDLVVKLSQGGIGGGNFCIHKYFYTGSSFWQSVQQEGNAIDEEQEGSQPPADDTSSLKFDPIDSRHLTNPDLIKSRIVSLLKRAENGLHHYHNLLVTIGFSKPKKRDRRFFIIRIRELIRDRVIEKVIVPKEQTGSSRSKSALCIRLVEDPRNKDVAGVVVQPGDTGDEDQDADADAPEEKEEVETKTAPVIDMTIHRQIVKLLEEAGENGLTLNEISALLGMFDRRTIELLLYRLERFPPPPHLADLTICDSIENVGRQRHHRFYTLNGYLEFIRRENIDDAGRNAQYTSVGQSKAGGFYEQIEGPFFKTPADLADYEDNYRDTMHPAKEGVSRKIGRPRKEGARRKKPVDRSKPAKRGRPKKIQTEDAPGVAPEATKAGTKRKRKEDSGDGPIGPPTKKPKGRKKKDAVSKTDMDVDATVTPSTSKIPTNLEVPLSDPTHDAGAVELVQEASGMDVETANIPIPQPPSVPAVPAVKPIVAPFQSASEPAIPIAPTLEPIGTPSEPVFAPSEQPRIEPSVASTVEDVSVVKRKVADTGEQEEPPAKRWKSGRPKRTKELVNISQLRAENEILRVVDEAGGIVNTSPKEFFEAHSRVIAALAEAREPTSMPVGTQPDRRTLQKIIERLVDRGKLKTMTITAANRVIQPRMARLIYYPSVSQEQIDAFLVSLREEIPTPNIPLHRILEAPAPFTRSKITRFKDFAFREHGTEDAEEQEEWCRTLKESGEDDELMRSKFLSEGQTVAQIYGYLLGRARRSRELHQFTLSQLETPELIPQIVSKSKRIVAFSYFCRDLPVSTYFAITSNVEYNAELYALMSTPEGRAIPLRDLPPHLSDQLQIGRARARSRIIDLLEILTALQLIVPLQASESEKPHLTCEPHDEHPTRFDMAPPQKFEERGTTDVLALYWQFTELAPIYLFGQHNEWPPLFHRDVPVRTADESMVYWTELEDACLHHQKHMPMGSSDSMTGPCMCPASVARKLRRRQAWVSSYTLSWCQKQYLYQRWTDPSKGYTPLNDPDGGLERIQHVCEVIFAPFEVVHSYFLTCHQLYHKTVEKMRVAKTERRQRKSGAEAAERDRALLAQKAAQARAQLEADWDALMTSVHPDPLPYGCVSKLKALRAQYIQSRASMTPPQWKIAIKDIISSSRSGRRNPTLPSVPRKRTIPTAIALIPQVTTKDKSVEEMVEQLREKGAAFSNAGDSRRRYRFPWNPEYDELVRDVSAIVKARCRTWHRLDWGAFDQLFPTLSRNIVRQRLTTLRQDGGAEPYLRALEDKWYELWMQHRGTPALPDEHPDHPSDFDAITHVEFLRKYIDKQALRVGLSRVANHPATGAVLTENVSGFMGSWTIQEVGQPTDITEVMWNTSGDEHRENTLRGIPFTISLNPRDPSDVSGSGRTAGVAEAALKMVLGTRGEDYDADAASTLLENVGQEAVHRATQDLSARGVISDVGNSNRKKPGRHMKISELNEDLLDSFLPPDLCTDACILEDSMEEDIGAWKQWNLLATSGEMAAFVEVVSNGQLDLKIDISEPASYREALDWNSKKVDDDMIECRLLFRFGEHSADAESDPPSPERSTENVAMEVDEQDLGETHGMNNGQPAACRKTSDSGIITCSACIAADRAKMLAGLDLDKRTGLIDLFRKLDNAGPDGIPHDYLSINNPSGNPWSASLISSIQPIGRWLGYTRPVLVSTLYVDSWSVAIPGRTIRLVQPRRWFNIKGDRMEGIWYSGLRSIVGILLGRPGITQRGIRKKLEDLFDRQETNDLLTHLLQEEMLLKSAAPTYSYLLKKEVGSLGGEEEDHIYWSLAADTWYRINA